MEIQTLQQDIKVQERQIENLEQFIQRVHKYKDLDELTPYALRELVKGVYIEAPDKSSGKRRQNIRISYDLVGFKIKASAGLQPGFLFVENCVKFPLHKTCVLVYYKEESKNILLTKVSNWCII